MDPFYIVDGSGYIFRAYYAVQPLTTSSGFPTNALFGFTRMLAKLLRDVEAHYIAVTFDTGEKTFRHERYSEYKANRAECPEDLSPQMPYFRKIVEALGLKSLEKPGFEADDIIATLVSKVACKDRKVVIVSGDKDLTQLVNDQVEVWDAMRDVVFDTAGVKEKFGVLPEQMIDYLSLVGDSSDNIPGVSGVGPKTAQRLIEQFGSVGGILENLEQIGELSGLRGAKGIQNKIESGTEQLRLSQELVRLDTDVEPFNRIGSVEEFEWHKPDDELLGPLFEELEFGSMLESLKSRLQKGDAQSRDPYADKRYEVITQETLQQFVDELSQAGTFAFDTETSSLDEKNCTLVGMSFSWQQNTAYYLPMGSEIETERNLDSAQVRELLNPIFSDPEKKKVGHHLKFDVKVLEEQAYTVRGLSFDSMLCAHIINPDRRDYGLKSLAAVHLGESMREYKEIVGDLEHIGLVDIDSVGRYACHDAEASWRLFEILGPKLREGGAESSLRRVFDEIEIPLISVLAAMERAGIKIDVERLEALGAEFGDEIERLRAEIFEIAGSEINLNSPKQLSVLLFEQLGLSTKGIKKTQLGYSTSASALEKLSHDHEIVAKLLEYRELHKLSSTYIEALKRLVHVDTNRIHARFNQAVAATGRLSSSDPNLQNIPIRNPRGRRIREAFIAEPGFLLLSADYSQIELRVLAHLSGDRQLIESFKAGEDIHLRTAKEIFGAELLSDEEISDLRRIAKTINFGLIYGMSAFRLAGEIGVSRKQAQIYIDNYFGRYPKVLEYFDRVSEQSETEGYVETMFGRRRYVNELETAGRDAGYRRRSMMNAPIQGTAAEVIKIAMINLHRRLAEYQGSARMVLQVHDELVIEADQSLADEVGTLIVSEMEQAVELAVPLKVDLRRGTTWGGSAQ